MTWSYRGHSHRLDLSGLSLLEEHLLLKMLLNTHSTLLMGRLGRYHGNVMTWVRPSNNKLIDRAVRYVSFLLGVDAERFTYAELVEACLEEFAKLGPDEPVVLRVVERLQAR